MEETVVWLLAFFLVYAAFCIFVGVRASRRHIEARAYFSPTGGIATWVFAISATTALFAGLAVTGHPAQVFQDGFQFVNASFFVIFIPLAGMIVQKRQWLLAKKFGYVTPGEMYSEYFGGHTIAIISVGIAVMFAVPFLAMLFSAAGSLLRGLTNGAVPRELAMWGLACIVLLYSVMGGLRAVAQVGTVQGALFAGAMLIIGSYAVEFVGGLSALGQGLAAIAALPVSESTSTQGFGGGDFNALFAVPGVIQWTAGLGVEQPTGGPWTAVMCLSYALSMMGLVMSPGFSVWAYASRSPRGFSIHQIWGGAFCAGVLLFIFSSLQGMSAHLLGADDTANQANIAVNKMLPVFSVGQQGDLVQHLIKAIGSVQHWLLGLLAVAAVAAIQATSGSFLVTSGNIVARDIYKKYLNHNASWQQQKVASGVCMLVLCLAALMLASFTMNTVLVLAALAVPFSFQLLPSLLGVLWLPWITHRAAAVGLFAGLVVVVLTEPLGQVLTGYSLPWGRWPWTIHSGVWGMFFNICICVVTASFAKPGDESLRQAKSHEFLRASSPPYSKTGRMQTAAWILLLVWVFFAAGPGAVLGNKMFGQPGGGYEGWVFGVPSVWAWQVFWWILGVGLVWLLAEKMRMSTISDPEFSIVRTGEVTGVADDR